MKLTSIQTSLKFSAKSDLEKQHRQKEQVNKEEEKNIRMKKVCMILSREPKTRNVKKAGKKYNKNRRIRRRWQSGVNRRKMG